MKNVALVVVIMIAFVAGLFFYGTFPREGKIDYEDLQLTELRKVLCVAIEGNVETFHIPMPSFEGFSVEDREDLENQYAQGFCNSMSKL